jgi:polysaccharide export outer membrane protein
MNTSFGSHSTKCSITAKADWRLGLARLAAGGHFYYTHVSARLGHAANGKAVKANLREGVMRKRSGLIRIVILSLCAAVVACSQSLPPPQELPDSGAAGTPRYVIGPLDQLQIFVAGAPELSVIVPVNPDGWISTPLAEDIQAAGKMPSELASEIEAALRPYVQEPDVSVVMQQFADTSAYTVRVMGAVKNPMSVPYRPRMSVLDAMVAADGLDEFAAGNRAVLIRSNQGGGEDVYQLRLQDLLVEADLSANAPVRPGDVIIVPEGLL